MIPIVTANLKLRRALWNLTERKAILNAGLSKAAETLEGKLKSNIDESTPAGRLYTKRLITERKSKANSNFRLRRGTTTRVVTGREVYRASAPGQPPARRFSGLYNSLKVRRVAGKLQIIARVKAPAAEALDDPQKFNRPFFRSVIDDFFQNEFKDEVRKSIQELKKAK